MKFRFGLALVSAMSLVFGACASGGGGGGSRDSGVDLGALMGEAQGLEEGESERDDTFTRAAEEALENAEEAEDEAVARDYYQSAAASADMGIEADSTNPLAYYLAGQAYLGAGDYFAAAERLDRAEELRPVYTVQTERMRETAWVELYRGGAPLLNEGDYEGAADYFAKADAIYDGRPEARITLGQIYAQLGRNDEAVEALRGALAIVESDRIDEVSPEMAESWRTQAAELPGQIARILVGAGRNEEAVEQLNGMLAEDPDNIANLRMLGSAYVSMDQPDSATAVFSRILDLPGLNSGDYYETGVGFYRIGAYAEAAEAFGAGAAQSAYDRDNVEMWARALQLAYPTGQDAEEPPAGKVEEMQAASEQWIELDPFNPNAYLILAQAVNKQGDGERAGELIGAIEELAVTLENSQLQRYTNGGAIAVGAVRNKTLPEGSTVTVEITFYDEAGTALSTEQARVQLGAAESTGRFRVEYPVDSYIAGYSLNVVW